MAAYILAIIASSLTAVWADRFTDSDILISVVSTLGGTVGFLVPAIGLYFILNIPEYRRRRRSAAEDFRVINRSYFESLIATYAVRIPLQFILQKVSIEPGLAAPVAQTLAGQVGNVVRIYGNYKRRLFGHQPRPVDAPVEENTP